MRDKPVVANALQVDNLIFEGGIEADRRGLDIKLV